jgi:hypothetical protein
MQKSGASIDFESPSSLYCHESPMNRDFKDFIYGKNIEKPFFMAVL